jgi:hypothetical protein
MRVIAIEFQKVLQDQSPLSLTRRFVPKFRSVSSAGSEAGGLAALRRQSKEVEPIFQGLLRSYERP